MKRAAFALLLAPLLAHAALGVTTMGALLKGASKVAIVLSDGHGKGRVITALRGVKKDELLDAPSIDKGTTALIVCDGDDCGVGVDRGGYYVIHLPGFKAPILTIPGVVESTGVKGLVDGTGAKPICVRAQLHFIDDPASDQVLEGKFAAEDGTGTLKAKVLGAKPRSATLIVGGPTHLAPDHATIRLDNGISFSGGYFVRAPDGCYGVNVLPEPLSRTPARLAKDLAGQVTTVAIARGTWSRKGGGSVPVEVRNDGTLVSPAIAHGAPVGDGSDKLGGWIGYDDGILGTLRVVLGDKPSTPYQSFGARYAVAVAGGGVRRFQLLSGSASSMAGFVELTSVADP